jgi:transposase-like protein
MYRGVDQHGQIIDLYLSDRRDRYAARRFFTRALTTLKVTPTEVAVASSVKAAAIAKCPTVPTPSS